MELTYDGVSYSGSDMLPLSGETIAAPLAQLWLNDKIIARETGPVSGSDPDAMTLEIAHPYSDKEGAYCDQTSKYNLKRSSSYVIISDFGGSRDGLLLKKRQRMLEAYQASGLSDSSRQVLFEPLFYDKSDPNLCAYLWKLIRPRSLLNMFFFPIIINNWSCKNNNDYCKN